MNDAIMRHIVAGLATFLTAIIYYAGYISGGHGWWWTVVAVLIIYGIVYKVIDAGH